MYDQDHFLSSSSALASLSSSNFFYALAAFFNFPAKVFFFHTLTTLFFLSSSDSALVKVAASFQVVPKLAVLQRSAVYKLLALVSLTIAAVTSQTLPSPIFKAFKPLA